MIRIPNINFKRQPLFQIACASQIRDKACFYQMSHYRTTVRTPASISQTVSQSSSIST